MRWLARIDLKILAIIACVLFFAVRTWAVPIGSGGPSSAPCAVLENFGGDLQVLDSSRTHLITLERSAAVPCDGWISTKDGWAKIKHQDGFQVSVGANTFVQVMDSKRDGAASEHFVLYRGHLYAQAGGGSGELRVLTANARARMNRGVAIIGFSPEDEESQLITLDHLAWFENRFSRGSKVEVKAGESSTLNFKMMRVVPSTPRVVAIASLKAKLAELHIDEKDQSYAVRAVKRRQERMFASKLVETDEDSAQRKNGETGEEGTGARKHASHGKSKSHERKIASDGSEYVRHKVDKDDAVLKDYWVKKMVAGEKVGEQILHPGQFYGRPQKVTLEVEDPAAKMNDQQKKKEDAEKRKLIEELSKIRVE